MTTPTSALTRRGTTNRNVRGNVADRAVRRAFLLTTFGDGETCPCYRCGLTLTDSTITVDRIRPGRDGGRYTRDNIRPACGSCNSETGGALATPTRTRSQIGRASRDKGARFERAVAAAVRPWWPKAKRSRDNGSVNTDDTGDLLGTNDALFWSLKDDRKGASSPPGRIGAWLAEAVEKAGPGRIPLLVQKRAGHADPLSSWCWLQLGDLVALTDGAGFYAAPVRLELRTVLFLLAAAGLATMPDPTEYRP